MEFIKQFLICCSRDNQHQATKRSLKFDCKDQLGSPHEIPTRHTRSPSPKAKVDLLLYQMLTLLLSRFMFSKPAIALKTMRQMAWVISLASEASSSATTNRARTPQCIHKNASTVLAEKGND